MSEQDYQVIYIVPGEEALLDVYAHNSGPMNFDDAVKTCESLGNGWRLPTKDELNTLYNNYQQIHGLGGDEFEYTRGYWSSESPDGMRGPQLDVAWVQIFESGFQYSDPKGHAYYVRPVRNH
jgi:hypothetical protein